MVFRFTSTLVINGRVKYYFFDTRIDVAVTWNISLGVRRLRRQRLASDQNHNIPKISNFGDIITSWHQKVHHNFKNRPWRQKVRHDVKHVMTPWCQKTRKNVITSKTSSWRQQICCDITCMLWRKELDLLPIPVIFIDNRSIFDCEIMFDICIVSRLYIYYRRHNVSIYMRDRLIGPYLIVTYEVQRGRGLRYWHHGKASNR